MKLRPHFLELVWSVECYYVILLLCRWTDLWEKKFNLSYISVTLENDTRKEIEKMKYSMLK